jgi:N-methylhydantoinase A/oxoprolinase/acetone carboxylase beta subunit
MGGTTAKICFLDDYQPQMSRSFEVARHYRNKNHDVLVNALGYLVLTRKELP